MTNFVEMVKGYGFEGVGDEGFRLETVIFGGALGSLYAILQFIFAPIWGRLSDRVGAPKVAFTNLRWNMPGLWVVDHRRQFLGFGSFSYNRWNCQWQSIRRYCIHC